MAQKSTELEQYLVRVQELEDMYRRLEEALEDERRARQDEEALRRLQARWVQQNQGSGGRSFNGAPLRVAKAARPTSLSPFPPSPSFLSADIYVPLKFQLSCN